MLHLFFSIYLVTYIVWKIKNFWLTFLLFIFNLWRIFFDKFKKNASMETEVEKARHLLEDDEEMEEDSSDEDTDDDIKILEE